MQAQAAVSQHRQAQAQQPREAVQQPFQPPRYASRTQIRHAIHAILRRLNIQRLVARGQQPILTKAQRAQIRRQSNMLESLFYRRATSMEIYQNLDTIEQRIYEAGRLIRAERRRVEMELESQRRILAAAALEEARLKARLQRGFR